MNGILFRLADRLGGLVLLGIIAALVVLVRLAESLAAWKTGTVRPAGPLRTADLRSPGLFSETGLYLVRDAGRGVGVEEADEDFSNYAEFGGEVRR